MRQHLLRFSVSAWLLAAMLSIAAGTAWAYPLDSFKRVEPILLPDGQVGTMRIIVWDGVRADLVRIVILDAESRLIARSPQTYWLSLVCDAPLRCYGYDHGSGEVFAPDPATFGKDGPVVHPVDDRDDLWQIEGGDAVWGVTVRPATWREWFSGQRAAFLAVSPLIPAFYAALGVVAGLCFIGVRAPGRTGLQGLLWLVGLAFRVTLCATVAYLLLIAVVMGDTVPSVMLYPVLAGVLLAWLLGPRIERRLRSVLVTARRPAPPAPAP